MNKIIQTKQSLARLGNDFYPTQTAVTQVLLDRININGTVLEPCAGDGAISSLFDGCITNDPFNQGWDYSLDAAAKESWEHFGEFDWVVTNPPFSDAHRILPLAYEHARVGVAFLLRLSYLEPCRNRAEWLQAHASKMTHQIVLNPRPKFRADTKGSDNVTVCWLVWQKQPDRKLEASFVTDWQRQS